MPVLARTTTFLPCRQGRNELRRYDVLALQAKG